MEIVDLGAIDEFGGEGNDLVGAALRLFLLLAGFGFIVEREIIEGEGLRRFADSFML